MITRNWYILAKNQIYNYLFENRITTTAGTASEISLSSNNNSTVAFYSTSSAVQLGNGSGIVVGAGNTPPTINDYKLENQITNGITSSIGFSENGRVITITNTSADNITIKEIGFVGSAYKSSSGYSCLIDRTLLETPLTIPAGGVGIITYNLSLQVPV